MSLEALPVQHKAVGPVESAVNPETAQLTAEGRFAAHVEQVRTTGDGIDERAIGFSRMAGAAISLASGALLTTPAYTAEAGVRFGAASAAAFIAYELRCELVERLAMRRATAKLADGLQHELNISYELLRTKKRPDNTHDVEMRWYGAADGDQSRAQLRDDEIRRVATLAKVSGVDRLAITETVLDTHFESVQKDIDAGLRIERTPLWLARHKGSHYGNFKSPGLAPHVQYSGTPDQWLDYVQQKKPDTVPRFVEAGRRRIGYVDPNSPITHLTYGSKAANAWQTAGVNPVMYDLDTTKKGQVELVQVPLAVHVPQGYNEHITLHEPGKRPRNERGIRAMAAVAVFAATIGGAVTLNHFGDKINDRSIRATAEEIGAETGISPSSGSVRRAARVRLGEQSAAGRIWNSYRDLRAAYNAIDLPGGAMSSNGGNSSTVNPTDGIGGTVGNLRHNKPDTVVRWSLTPHNLPESALAGHWSTDTASLLEGSVQDGKPVLSWSLPLETTPDGGQQEIEPTAVFQPPTTLPAHYSHPAIEVKGEAGAGDSGLKYQLSIPVLEGYTLKAANAGGEPVVVVRKADNTFMIEASRDSGKPDIYPEDTLQYWVVPDKSRVTKAAGPVAYSSNEDTNAGFFNEQAIEAAFDKAVPGNPSPEAFTKGMQTSFTYNRQPWPEDKLAMDKPTADKLVTLTFEQREAVCNVAATMLTMYDHSLNPVFEYNNSNDGSPLTQLDASEAHARVTDPDGKKYDPTPVTYLRENARSHDPLTPPVLPLGLMVGAVAAGAVGYKKRRVLQQTTKAVAGAASEKVGSYLYDRSVQAVAVPLHEAADAVFHQSWAAPGTLIKPGAPIHHAAAHAAATLREPAHHGTGIRTSLAPNPAVSSKAKAVIAETASLAAARPSAPTPGLTHAERRGIRYAIKGALRYKPRHRKRNK